MRKELELIEKIENYLLGKMDPKTKADFEKEIQNNPDLAQKVQAQSQIIEALENMDLKSKINKGRRTFKLKKLGVKMLIGLGIIGAIATGYLLLNGSNQIRKNQKIEPSNHQNVLSQIDGGTYETELENQIFIIDNRNDTVIETEDGMVIYIPENAFDVDGNYELLVKEAIQADDIVKAGLQTFDQEGNLLETGGMFRIEGMKNNELLSLNEDKEFTVNVPTNDKKGDMQLYDAVRNKDGNIEWGNPKPIENLLTPVDILSLDFYPPNYEDSLNAWGKSADKKYRDSLYYSFAGFCTQFENDTTGSKIALGLNLQMSGVILIMQASAGADTVAMIEDAAAEQCCILEPSKIKAIWNKKFNGTNVATKEFEERVQILHKMACEGEYYFDLYIQNIDKSLWYTDSIIWSTIGVLEPPKQVKDACEWDHFKRIYARRDGKVQLKNKSQQKLQAYFEQKSKAVQEEVSKVSKEYYQKHEELKQQFQNAQNENEQANIQQLADQMEQETQYMLRDIKQPASQSYMVSVPSTGWKNIDQKVREKVWARESGAVSDGYNSVTLSFSEKSFSIQGKEKYDRIKFYLLPQEINSYIRVQEKEGKWTYKTNDDMKYDLVVIAYDDQGNIFSHQEKAIREGKSISLKQTDIKGLQRQLNITDIEGEVTFIQKDLANMKRERKFREDLDFRKAVEEVIFCNCTKLYKPELFNNGLEEVEIVW